MSESTDLHGSVNALIDATAAGRHSLARRLIGELGHGSWLVVVDRVAGVVLAEPQSAGARHDELAPWCARLWERPGSVVAQLDGDHVLLQTLAAHPELVLAVATSQPMDARSRRLVNTAARLASLLAAQARRERRAAAQINAGLLRLLLAGETDTAAILAQAQGGLPTGPVRIYRVASAVPVQALVFDAVYRVAADQGLVAALGGEVVALVPAGGTADAGLRDKLGRTSPARFWTGVSDPAPTTQALAAYREAGHALHAGRVVDRRITVFADLAEHRLLALIPREQLLEWSATLLRPVLERSESRNLTASLHAWLSSHGRSSAASGALGIDRKTVEKRIRLAGRLLDTDLDDECVRVRLHLALHTLQHTDETPEFGPKRVDPSRDCLVWLLDIERSLDWAAAVMKPLKTADPDGRLRHTLHVWLSRHGDHGATATDLGVHRNTVAKRITRVEEITGQSLDYVGNRAELYLALLTDEHATRGTLPPEAYTTSQRLPARFAATTKSPPPR